MIKTKEVTLQEKVLEILSDGNWHCRTHEYKGVPSGQLAGGGGIQGLKRGTKTRLGLKIESKSELCHECKSKTRWDRWTGDTQTANAPSGIPKALQEKILVTLSNFDEIEQRKRPAHELVIDHRFPMIRWGASEEKLSKDMEDTEIRKKFQLLKSDVSGNHNLLKSRACESCFHTGKRGAPLGIKFFYEGCEKWPEDIPKLGVDAEKGCVGCGWYDFSAWRKELNNKLTT